MQILTFGAACSPSSAHYIKDQNALRFADKYPRAVEAIVKHHYVDDLLDSVDTIDEANTLAKQVRFIHQQGGFEIRHWASKSASVLAAMGEPPKTSLKSLHDNFEISAEKVLGMWWCHEIDDFTYKVRIHKLNQHILVGKRRPTKREVLRTLMSVFDPLGFLEPFLVYIKMLLQEIWRTKIGWDEMIYDYHYEKWLLWVGMLSKIEDVRIPRCYRTKTLPDVVKDTQLHIFVDASEYSYAAVAYLRIESE